jgi:flagellar hook-associated protein 2
MVSQLVAAEKVPADTLASKQSDLSSQKSIIGSISLAMSNLSTAAKALDLDSEVKPLSATVSGSNVAVAVSAGATPGPHAIRVNSLAASQVTQTRSFTSSAAGALGDGGVDITVGGTTKSISWSASDSLADVADRINAAGAGVTASLMKVDDTSYRLVMTAKDTGTAKAPTFVDHGDGLDLSNSANTKRLAKDASVTIDGVDVTRGSNTVSDALPGMTLTLNSVTAADAPDTVATVALDTKSLGDKLQSFVSAYNAINASLHNQLDYNGTTKGTNTLFGDSTLRGIQASLASMMSSAYGGSNLSIIGITRDKTGLMSFDSTKMAAALTKDPNAVSTIFVSGGLAGGLTKSVDAYTATGGILQAKTDGMTARSKMYQTEIDRINANADALQIRLEAQFTAMEEAVSKMKTASSQLTSLLPST